MTIPIRVYSAIESSETIRFNQLHSEDYGRIGYEKKCKKCNNIVDSDEIVKGFEYEPDQYVVIDQEDLDKLRVKSTRVIEIEGFVNSDEVHHALFDTPYYIGPDGPVAAKTYALLSQVLEDSKRVAIGRVALRDRENIVLLAPQGPGILMYKLRYPKELRAIDDVPQLDGIEADKEQLKLANTLVDSMLMSFDKIEAKDAYVEAVKEMVMAKVEGREIITVAEEEKEVVDIMSALKQSIEKAKDSKKPMKKATGAKKKAAAAKRTPAKKTSARAKKKTGT